MLLNNQNAFFEVQKRQFILKSQILCTNILSVPEYINWAYANCDLLKECLKDYQTLSENYEIKDILIYIYQLNLGKK